MPTSDRPDSADTSAWLEAVLAEIEQHRRMAGEHDRRLYAELQWLTSHYQDPESVARAQERLVRGARYQDGLSVAADILRRHLAESRAHHPVTRRTSGS